MDSGVGFVQSIWFFFFSIEEQKRLIILMIAKLNIWVWSGGLQSLVDKSLTW